jgi:hypothetical protein
MVTVVIPEGLIVDLKVLQDRGFIYEVVEENPRIFIVFKDYPLPLGSYNIEKTDLLIFTTPYYPNAGFDMFWVDQNLLLKNNGIPQGAQSVESYLGRSWRRFSYHPYNTRPWNPSEDSVITFMAYVEQRLKKGD